MEKVNWKVEGMTCSNCALSVNKVLTRQGMQKVAVNAITGDVVFETPDVNGSLGKAKTNIEGLGYQVVDETAEPSAPKRKFLSAPLQKFTFCLPFTLLLMMGHMGMYVGLHVLHNPWWQFALCVPVYIVGMDFFGKSAVRSLRSGVPNMNVLIVLGATAAFIYSLIGTITHDSSKIFYETAASILTIVFLVTGSKIIQ